MKILICAAAIAAVFSFQASAGQMTLGDLHRTCTSDDEGDKAACTFYILGVSEGVSLATSAVADASGSFREIKDKPICLPEGISGKALELVVKMAMGQDLAVFPKDRDLPAVSFVMVVIRKQFACGKVKGQ